MCNSNKFKSTLVVFAGVLVCLTAFSALLLSASKASADTSTTANVSVTVPAICSLTVDPDEHSITVDPGDTYTIGHSDIKAVCNDPAGLAVYAVGYTNDTYGNNDFVATVNNNTYTIPSAAAPTPTTSQWNMTLSPIAGDYVPTIANSFDTAQAVPTTYTKVAYRNTATDLGDNATGANFRATFNVYVDHTQAAGTYTAKVKFLLVHPSTHPTPDTPIAVPGQICYYGNGADEGAMACQTKRDDDSSSAAISANTYVRFRPSNFSRSGYGFTGWNTKEDGTGAQYGPMETITFTQDMYDNGLVLFANWKAAEANATMQTFDDTVSSYSTAPIGTAIALRDERDDDVYAVAKLADGKWWMIENLRLDYNANITTSNTQSNNGAWGGVFIGLAEPESANFSDSTTANTLYSTTNITGSNIAYRFPRYNNNNIASRVANLTTYGGRVYSFGNYYTWAAAVADTTNYVTNNQSVTSTSLCPSGWHLPTGGDKNNSTSSEWWTLTRTIMGFNPENISETPTPNYNGTPNGVNASRALRAYPTNLLYSGDFNNSKATTGTAGNYWSSTAYGGDAAYYETLAHDFVYPGTNYNYKRSGRTVRCIAN